MVTFGLFDRPGRVDELMQVKFVMGEYAVGLLVHAVFGRISEWMGAGTHKTSTLGQILHFFAVTVQNLIKVLGLLWYFSHMKLTFA